MILADGCRAAVSPEELLLKMILCQSQMHQSLPPFVAPDSNWIVHVRDLEILPRLDHVGDGGFHLLHWVFDKARFHPAIGFDFGAHDLVEQWLVILHPCPPHACFQPA